MLSLFCFPAATDSTDAISVTSSKQIIPRKHGKQRMALLKPSFVNAVLKSTLCSTIFQKEAIALIAMLVLIQTVKNMIYSILIKVF